MNQRIHPPWTGVAALSAWAAMGVCQLGAAEKSPAPPSPQDSALTQFHQVVSPILQQRCYECHGDGAKKAGLAFDELTTKGQILQNPELWLKVLRNTRSHLMPPPGETQPTGAEQLALEQWIKTGAFGLDPAQPDPGRVTVRRLNRTEYRNTIRDLIGVEFDAENALASDDIGYGFDNIGDVLTLSPMRMEKFLEAAQTIVKKGVPMDSRAISEQMALGQDFVTADGSKTGDPMSYYQERKVGRGFKAPIAGDYRLVLAGMVDGRTKPDPGRCKIIVTSDGKEFFSQEYAWHDCQFYFDERVIHWEPGEHQVEFHLVPLEPPEKQLDKMDYKIVTVQVQGPLDPKDWQQPPNYTRFFPRDRPPEDPAQRRSYAREVLTGFATKAYRRPVSAATLDRLVNLAESIYQTPGTTFEVGVSRAIVAILSSPRFLFRIEDTTPAAPGQPFANVDEYALASRLSYFLWSTMPDDELFKLAARGTLRKNLGAQVQRMLADAKAFAFVENFSGQWLQSREILHTPLNRVIVLEREGIKLPARSAGRGPALPPSTDLPVAQREALKQEAEAYFGHVVRGNRSVLELIDSDYAFLNETLAAYYGLPAGTVTGPALRKVALPPGDPRGGGVLTMASTLAVTSNPTRTSPVKRGKWILENILGAPAPPPPPNIPSLEETEKKVSDRMPTQREVLAIHRQEPLCASCHDRMDPLGLALENFNALGLYRTRELGQPVDATGALFTGETFQNIREVKHILATGHRLEIYRALTEKVLIYALGRGLEYYDVPTVDKITERLDHADGRFGELLMGVIESAPFQQRRATPGAKPASSITQNTPPDEPKLR